MSSEKQDDSMAAYRILTDPGAMSELSMEERNKVIHAANLERKARVRAMEDEVLARRGVQKKTVALPSARLNNMAVRKKARVGYTGPHPTLIVKPEENDFQPKTNNPRSSVPKKVTGANERLYKAGLKEFVDPPLPPQLPQRMERRKDLAKAAGIEDAEPVFTSDSAVRLHDKDTQMRKRKLVELEKKVYKPPRPQYANTPQPISELEMRSLGSRMHDEDMKRRRNHLVNLRKKHGYTPDGKPDRSLNRKTIPLETEREMGTRLCTESMDHIRDTMKNLTAQYANGMKPVASKYAPKLPKDELMSVFERVASRSQK